MPGGGKSTVGRQLARQLNLPFVDSDTEVETWLGEAIRPFFDREGEEAFRNVEEQTIATILGRQTPMVLATGGGAVLRAGSRQRLHEQCTVIYLRSTPEEIYRRIRHDTRRPLLQVENPLQRLQSLYAVRDPLYRRCAHFVIETGRPSVGSLVNMILMQLELAGLVDTHRCRPSD